MEHSGLFGEEVRFALEVEPNQPMTLQRQAPGAQRIASGLPSIGQKLSKAGFANRAFHLIATIENSHNP